MKARPIPMSAPNIVPIQEDRKTQTRRIIRPQPFIDPLGNFWWNCSNYGQDASGPRTQAIASPVPNSETKRVLCPYGRPGDKLWVKEAWRTDLSLDPLNGTEIEKAAIRAGYPTGWAPVEYEADGARRDWIEHFNGSEPNRPGRYRHARFMPRWASRILLEITEIRIERLQEISEADAVAEGIDIVQRRMKGQSAYGIYQCKLPDGKIHYDDSAYNLYRSLWTSINGLESWNENPYVWVIAFRRIDL